MSGCRYTGFVPITVPAFRRKDSRTDFRTSASRGDDAESLLVRAMKAAESGAEEERQ